MRLWLPVIVVVAVAVALTAHVTSDGFLSIGPCDAGTLSKAYGPMTTIYQVEDGELAGICHGEDDPAVYRAWSALTAFTTASERSTIAAFAGFINTSGKDVIAYAATLDLAQTSFLVGVDLEMVQFDLPIVRRVMVHEFAHVLTGTAQGADRAEPQCASKSNRYGCVTTSNYLGLWVHQFWDDDELAALDTNGYRSASEASRRCAQDPGFPSTYGATNPSEDFAESLVFFMFSNEVAPTVRPRLQFLATFPELVQMRNRIAAAGFADTRRYVHSCA